jgi:hypothetical protein
VDWALRVPAEDILVLFEPTNRPHIRRFTFVPTVSAFPTSFLAYFRPVGVCLRCEINGSVLWILGWPYHSAFFQAGLLFFSSTLLLCLLLPSVAAGMAFSTPSFETGNSASRQASSVYIEQFACTFFVRLVDDGEALSHIWMDG